MSSGVATEVELGLIEGYYGGPWTWPERRAQVDCLKAHGYSFYIYAPKADVFLRRRWRESPPPEIQSGLEALAAYCRGVGVRFGVGLSPFEIYRDFNTEAQDALARKLDWLDALGIDDLGILFDDMRGDLPDLAQTQVRILHWIAERSRATRLIVCPTYYSDDAGLDRYFGARPAGYLEAFGAGLDPAIEVFWTGEEVCSREFSPGHLERVGEALRRKPFLWDNYPVNDGPRMSPHLHLRAFTGRPASIGARIAAHAVNPALQPTLSRIPALTLAESYRLGEAYQYVEAFDRAADAVLGEDLAKLVRRHLQTFQDEGRDRLSAETVAKLRPRYDAFDHPAAREIVGWLDGHYVVTAEMMEGA
jgi:hyaluronoglucosaminidase